MDIAARYALAEQYDEIDPLISFKSEFYIPEFNGTVSKYFLANSLGLLSKESSLEVKKQMHKWQTQGLLGYFEGDDAWIDYANSVATSLSTLIGAKAKEVVVMNSLTSNLHNLLCSFYHPNKKRYKLVLEESAFPSDYIALSTQAKWHGFDPETAIIRVPSKNGIVEQSALEAVFKEHGDSIAVLLLPSVQYYSGQVLDLKPMVALAKQFGCVVGLDLAHGIGNVRIQLSALDVDFAIWCHYKYLNSGPGAVGGAYINAKHHQNNESLLGGWWGVPPETRFEMTHDFKPYPDARAWRHSNPPVLSIAALKGSLRLIERAGGLDALRTKSEKQSQFLVDMLTDFGSFEIITPNERKQRGAQISLFHSEAKEILAFLKSKGTIVDYRAPNCLRVTPSPLYNSYHDSVAFVETVNEYFKS